MSCTMPWFDQLTESVYALGEAAREYQHAHRAAVLARQNVDVDRRQLHDGEIGLRGRTNALGGVYTQTPHEKAVYALGKLYMDAEHTTHNLYEHAALLYASGAAWAIASVQRGDKPERVEFTTDSDGSGVRHRLDITGLDRYVDAAKISAHYDALIVRLNAGEYAEDLAGRDYVADHEAGQMFECAEIAMGVADAAYAYGLLAERAVHFALLEPKREHSRQQAASRTASAMQTTEEP